MSYMVNGEDASGLGEDVRGFRHFNRMYTRLIGTLSEGLLDSKFSLSEARILYELATRTAPTATEIAQELGLDPGYLSRVLRKFELDALLRKKPSELDSRQVELRLTPKGKSAFKTLSALSDKQARSMLEKLAPAARTELMKGMRAIETILMKHSKNRQVVLRPHRVGDMGWIVHREGIGYAEQFGWDETFEAMVARIVDSFITNFDPARERCWIAETDGQNVAHVFLVKNPTEPGVARLRLLFVEPSARGLGLGSVLVNECVRFARVAGYRGIVLWTQSILTSAHRIYEQAGFRLVKEEPHQSFGHDLVGQEWKLELN